MGMKFRDCEGFMGCIVAKRVDSAADGWGVNLGSAPIFRWAKPITSLCFQFLICQMVVVRSKRAKALRTNTRHIVSII